jgi:hypothetical protein
LFIVNSRYFKVQTEGPSDFFFDRVEGGSDRDGGTEEEDLFADLPAQVSDIIGRSREQIDADDEAVLREFISVDDDNAPLPDNIIPPNEYVDYIFSEWKAPDVCYRKAQNVGNTQASIRFLNDGVEVKPTRVQLFEMLFPKEFVQQTILVETNKEIVGEPVQYGEFLRWLGLWFLMATLVGPRRRDFWSSMPVDDFEGAPFRLNRWMSRTRFEAILSAMRYKAVE